ncbi:MAG: acyltransferase [Lachnospiraceae bacterium]|nr:acyltransferase [Lachnospiraceae bacterium]
MNEKAVNNLVNVIKENIRGREIVFYGKNLELKTALERRGYKITKIFSGNVNILQDQSYPVYDKNLLKNLAEQYYVIFPFMLGDGGKLLKGIMDEYNYKYLQDYAFYVDEIWKYGERKRWDDVTGNNVLGARQGTIIQFSGVNNKIEIDDSVLIEEILKIECKGDNNYLKIGASCKFQGNNRICFAGRRSTIVIGNNCTFRGNVLSIYDDAKIVIDNLSDFGAGSSVNTNSKSKVIIEKDCMISWNVMIESGDGHAIFDVATGKRINNIVQEDGSCNSIEIGEHVWVGTRAMILGGKTIIGKGSVIGAQSVAKGKYPNNVTIAGAPARVIKENIAWARRNLVDDITLCGEYVDYTQK